MMPSTDCILKYRGNMTTAHQHPLLNILENRIAIIDGAMGTTIRTYGMTEADIRGERFKDATKGLLNNGDIFTLTQPRMIGDIHRRFLEAGADIIETNTFGATSISQSEFFVDDPREHGGRKDPAFYQKIIDEIGDLNWSSLTRDDLTSIAGAYYYFSVQFRENLELACDQNPWDAQLARLHREECDTDNLSPCSGVAEPGEVPALLARLQQRRSDRTHGVIRWHMRQVVVTRAAIMARP